MAVGRDGSALSRATQSPMLHRLATFCGWAVGTYLSAMLVWVLVPTAILGWIPLVVVSGSMEPLVTPGDVVLVEPVDHPLEPGVVVAFDDRDGPVLHRVVDLSADGGYVTRGDANPTPDSTPVAPERVLGRGRLLVPYLGMARVSGVWWAVVGCLAAVSISLWRRRGGVVVATAVGLLTIVGVASALAVFTHTTASGASSLGAITVAPPSDLTALCAPPVGVGDVAVELNWTASPTAGATGYQILHDGPSAGTNLVEVGAVASGTTTYTHDIEVSLLGSGTHTYAVRTELGPWLSGLSDTDAVDVTQVLVSYACVEQ